MNIKIPQTSRGALAALIAASSGREGSVLITEVDIRPGAPATYGDSTTIVTGHELAALDAARIATAEAAPR